MATSKENKAAANTGVVAAYNAQSTKDQVARALSNFALSDKQNTALADIELKQHSRQGAADRFSAAKKLQSSTKGILSSAGNGMQGSGLGNLLGMLRGRTDTDSGEVLGTLAQNQNATRRGLQDTLLASALSSRDAITNGVLGLRGIESSVSADRSNINPSLFIKPGTGAANLGSATMAKKLAQVKMPKATLSGYFMPEASKTAPQVTQGPAMTGDSYYDRLLNEYNRRG